MTHFDRSFEYESAGEHDLLALLREHAQRLGLVANRGLLQLERLDVVEELLEMRLHRLRVLRLAEYFEQIVVGNEVEARKDDLLRLQVHVERLLDVLETRVHLVELLVDALDARSAVRVRIAVDAHHDRLPTRVQVLELDGLFGQLVADILAGENILFVFCCCCR